MRLVAAAAIGAALFWMMVEPRCSGALAADADETLTPSELMANPEKYDGKHVDVRGYIVLRPESRNIFDSESGYRDGHGACLGLRGTAVMFQRFHRRYTKKISGVFRKKLCRDKEVCLYWCISGIELDKESKP